MSEPSFPSPLPARPSVEHLRKQAKDLVRAAHAGDAAAAARLRANRRRASPHDPAHAILADAQFAIAREYGFPSWGALVRHVRDLTGTATLTTELVRPLELRSGRPFTLADGTVAPADDVFAMFVAARAGDLRAIKQLIARAPALAVVEYNYTPPIHFAVREGHLAIAELFIERGADLAYRTYPFGDSLLMMAEEREHGDVAALLERHLSRRFAVAAGAREIIEAARAGDLARVQAELARTPDVARASNETGDTALHQAASNGHLHIVSALLDAGADPDAVRGDGWRPIHSALLPNARAGVTREQCAPIADALLARGARYTMWVAAMRGDHEFVRRALERDRSSVNEEDSCHRRPISAAAARNDVELARMLLAHGADPNAPEAGSPRGHALWEAVYHRRRELVPLLLDHGADPNAMVESSGRPMDHVKDDPELLALLRAHGGIEHPDLRHEVGRLLSDRRFDEIERMLREHPELVDEAGWSDGIMMGPASASDHEMLAFLMRLGARVPTVSKWAPYYYFKHEATARFLLEHGMDANHMNWHRFTLLHHMAAEGDLGKARLLIDHGARVDALDEEYRSTPLGMAARRGQRELVAFLLERGADPNQAGAPWATPLAWAQKRGHDEVATVLRAAGAGS